MYQQATQRNEFIFVRVELLTAVTMTIIYLRVRIQNITSKEAVCFKFKQKLR
jgi:hypothetical protein